MRWAIPPASTTAAMRSANSESWMSARVPESVSTCAISGGASRVFTGTNTAPSCIAPNITWMNSGLFSPR